MIRSVKDQISSSCSSPDPGGGRRAQRRAPPHSRTDRVEPWRSPALTYPSGPSSGPGRASVKSTSKRTAFRSAIRRPLRAHDGRASRPRDCLDDRPAAGALAVEPQLSAEPVEPADHLRFECPSSPERTIGATANSRSAASGFGSITSHGSRSAATTFSPWRSWWTRTSSPCVGASSRERDRGVAPPARRHPGKSPHRATMRLLGERAEPRASFQSRGRKPMRTRADRSLPATRACPARTLEEQRAPLVVVAEQPHRAVPVPALERGRLLLVLPVRVLELEHRGRAVCELDTDDVAGRARRIRLASESHSWRRLQQAARTSRYPMARSRGVAQPGSALRSGRRGPQFESGAPRLSAGAVRAPQPAEPFGDAGLLPGAREGHYHDA